MNINIIIKIVKGYDRKSGFLPSIPPAKVMNKRQKRRLSKRDIQKQLSVEYG